MLLRMKRSRIGHIVLLAVAAIMITVPVLTILPGSASAYTYSWAGYSLELETTMVYYDYPLHLFQAWGETECDGWDSDYLYIKTDIMFKYADEIFYHSLDGDMGYMDQDGEKEKWNDDRIMAMVFYWENADPYKPPIPWWVERDYIALSRHEWVHPTGHYFTAYSFAGPIRLPLE